MSQSPTINKTSPLPADEAKWIEFQKIDWTDQQGTNRVWEVASRKTRGKSGIDAVAIAPILKHPSRPTSTLIIKQFRPAVGGYCIELPAGLIDEKETPGQAAERELKEETGYEGKLISLSPTIVSDPGMTTANMQLAVVQVQLKEGDEEPEQHLDDGEFIERFVVPLELLQDRLLRFSKEKDTIVDARLFHWAAGIQFARDHRNLFE